MGLFGTYASLFSDFSLILEVVILSVFIIGFTYARKHLSNQHYKLMTIGFLINLFFVIFFMIGSRTIGGSSEFMGSEGIRRTVYLPVVIIHGTTSTLAFILAGYAIYYGYKHTTMKRKRVFRSRNDHRMHKKIGYTTLGVWSIAFLTGVLVYLMLYV
ncbi:MAG: DUF420 domain-containing protein, partial [Candidatus Hydrothermarchaeales archaeon]